MHRLTRDILFQLLSVFLVTLGATTFITLTAVLLREASDRQLSYVLVLRLVPYILPDALRFAIPATILFSACLVFGRMASANEIVALKSAGISPWRILSPCFVMVTLLSLGAVWLNDLADSWGRAGVRRVAIECFEQIAYGILRNQRPLSAAGFSINAKGVDGQRLQQPTITIQQNGKSPPVVIRAEWAELHVEPEHDTLTILLHNGSAVGGDVQGKFPTTIKRVFTLGLADADAASKRPAELALREIPEELVRQTDRTKQFEQHLAAKAAFSMATGQFEALADAAWQHDQLQLTKQRQLAARLKTEPHRRWSAGFSCLCFMAVGAPLAIRRRHGEFWTTFFLCFLPILIVYYPLFMLALDRAKLGEWPPQTIWLGNLVLLIWSAWLIRRVIRY
jgi:lipopolysaccharide export system permease protein